MKEMAEELGRVAHVFHGDAQRVARLRRERAEMPPSLAQLAVEPIKASCREPTDRLAESEKTILRHRVSPASPAREALEGKREPRRRLRVGELQNAGMALVSL